jgi:hypothetical protein
MGSAFEIKFPSYYVQIYNTISSNNAYGLTDTVDAARSAEHDLAKAMFKRLFDPVRSASERHSRILEYYRQFVADRLRHFKSYIAQNAG